MSTPTLAEVLSPILADMRIKAANLRQGAPRIAEFADVADWIDGWELAIATAAQNVGTSTPETATPEELAALNMAINRLPHACWEGKPACSTCSDAVTALRSLRERLALTPEPTEPERVNTLGGSPQEQGSLDAGACERCTPEDGDCLNAGCNRAAPDLRAAIDDARAKFNEVSERNGFPERDRLQQRVKELDEDRASLDWLDTLPCGISILGDRDFPQAMGMTPKAPGHSHTRQLIRECRAARAQEGKEMTESKYTARYTLQDNTLEQAERSALCDRQRIIARAEEKGTDA